jgi:hypothetical protein
MQKRAVHYIGNIEITESCRPEFTEVRIITLFSVHICETILCNRERAVIYTDSVKAMNKHNYSINIHNVETCKYS